MIYKMKKYFVIFVFLVILFCNGCYGCFQADIENEKSVATGSYFYQECCCTEPEFTAKSLKWLDPNNIIIGPGTDSNTYIEDQGGECLSLHISSSSISSSGSYRCVTTFNGVEYTQIYNLYVYDPLYFFNNTTPSQYLIHGTDSMIHCEGKGASLPRFKWTRGEDGQNEIFDSEKYQVTPGGLIIKNVTNEDIGIYKCTAAVMSTGEELEIDIDVKIMTKPTITHLTASPENVVIEEESLIIKCEADGYPYPEYIWNKIAPLKADNETRNITWHQDGNTIIFDSIAAEDAGLYECFAYNFVGNTSKIINVEVLVPPKIIGFSDRTAVEGTEIPMHCNATGHPNPNVVITYEGKSLTEEQDSMDAQFIPNFSILKVNRAKEGIYICNATNEVNFETRIMQLTVLHPPQFNKDQEIVWGWNGVDVNMICEPEANPPANITWKYKTIEDGKTIERDISEIVNSPVPDAHNYSIQITEGFEHYGLFECKATNNLGNAIKVLDLRKGYEPSKVLNASVDEVLATSATFIIEPPSDYIGPEVLGFMAEYDTNESYSITNIHRNRTWAIGIPYKLESLKPNTSYLIRFAAINRVGTGEWSNMTDFETLEKSAPEPPIWLVESLQPSSSNVLKWKEPEDNGEPIDYYMLRYCPVVEDMDEAVCKKQRIEGTTEQELTDLQYNTTYYFEIIAHNSEGDSAAANTSLLVPALVESLEAEAILSGGAIIGISIVVVLVCLLLLDVLLLLWRRQGIIASCCYKKSKKKPNELHSRDKKGLLKDNGESVDDTLRRPNNGHREYEYNKTTGIITGKHSSV